MPSPTYGAAGTYLTGATGTTANVAVPASVVANSIVLVFFYMETSPTITPPTGFTQKAFADNTIAGSQHRLYLFWKRATGADSGTYNFTMSPSVAWRSGVAIRIDGAVTTGDPFDTGTGAVQTAANTGNTTAAPAVSLTTTAADTLLVYSACTPDTAATYTPASGMTERVDTEEVTIDTLAKGAAGATGSLSATSSVSAAQCSILGAVLSGSGAAAGPVRRRRSSIAVMRGATR